MNMQMKESRSKLAPNYFRSILMRRDRRVSVVYSTCQLPGSWLNLCGLNTGAELCCRRCGGGGDLPVTPHCTVGGSMIWHRLTRALLCLLFWF